jgi:hypothetical protein
MSGRFELGQVTPWDREASATSESVIRSMLEHGGRM